MLAQILDAAADYGHLDPARNPARGSKRRVKRTAPQRPTMEPEQLPALLSSARSQFRPILAVLAGAGLRNGEACGLDWRDVNLASGTITVRTAKTDAGIRQVDLPLALREELGDHKARSERVAPDDPVFPNRDGERQTVSNVERRLKTAVRHANERLAQLGIEAISGTITPHSLRRLYACVRDDAVYVAEQLGHEDGAFSMNVYARAIRRRERLTGAALREFDRALQWAEMGRIAPEAVPAVPQPGLSASPEMASQSHKLASGPDSSAG